MKLRLHLVLSYKPIQCALKSNLHKKSIRSNVYSGTIGEDFYMLLLLMPCVTGWFILAECLSSWKAYQMLKGPNLLIENMDLIWIWELNVIFSVPISVNRWILEQYHFEILLFGLLSFVHEQVLWNALMPGVFIWLYPSNTEYKWTVVAALNFINFLLFLCVFVSQNWSYQRCYLMPFCGVSQVLRHGETILHSHQGVPWDSSIQILLLIYLWELTWSRVPLVWKNSPGW